MDVWGRQGRRTLNNDRRADLQCLRQTKKVCKDMGKTRGPQISNIPQDLAFLPQ